MLTCDQKVKESDQVGEKGSFTIMSLFCVDVVRARSLM